MSRVWARHYLDDWMSRAGDPRLPYWLRVAAAAYGSHGENGHALYKRGQLSLILANVDQDTGEVQPYGHVARAIADAVQYGWLEDGSYGGASSCRLTASDGGPSGTVRTLARRPRDTPERVARIRHSLATPRVIHQPPVAGSWHEPATHWRVPRSTPSL